MKKFILSTLILMLTLSVFFGMMTVNAEEQVVTPDKNNIRRIDEGTTFRYVAKDLSIINVELPLDYWVVGVGKRSDEYYEVEYNGVKLLVDYSRWGLLSSYDQDRDLGTYQFKPSTELEIQIPADWGIDAVPLYSTKECNPSEKRKMLKNGDKLVFLNSFPTENVYLVATNVDNEKEMTIGYVKPLHTNCPTLIKVPDLVLPPKAEPEVKPDKPVTPPDNGGEGGEVEPNPGTDSGSSIVKPNENNKPLPKHNNIVKIILIVCICILAGVLVFLIFKPTRDKKSGGYRQDDAYNNDDEYND